MNTPRYLTAEFIADIEKYIAPLSAEEKETYVQEGEECIRLREIDNIHEDPNLTPGEQYKVLVKRIGTYLEENTGKNFISDYQKIELTDTITLYSFQLPGGGNLNLFTTSEGKMVLDTGYGCFYNDCKNMLSSIGLDGFSNTKVVICTHGDADHCGASGYFSVKPVMHPTTKALLASGTRNYGTPNNPKAIFEKFYTTSINTISRMNIPEDIAVFDTKPLGYRGVFPIIGSVKFAGMNFEVWESLGGHIAGQLLLFEPNLGLLFTSDAFINFATLSKERADYCSIADIMVGSVNVDSEIARKERKELVNLAPGLNKELKEKGKRLYICCGHGAISVLDDKGNLVPACDTIRYSAQ